ncbi:uncharacterized protein LY89DRAFT_769160 [Mollisia scopiformis]|uniref:Uncharacterized protein n=1 Tax=Mollisia scopiformis TaxID=149040 RepID=A0A132B2E3_MOLSC|nr:uncharacterized protein LY89DRAFT_769160 [Mollisia scopiformis]KUJ06552.1 hypothetical protein LY89DRAFT_769160 [Mollisia scopiformis]
MSSNTTIHTGFWTNYSKGAVIGATLTLTNRNGGVLIAALAIFIQLIGGQSWGIISFIVHQRRTTTLARDGLHHQQQAVLRNNNSDASFTWQFSRIGWAWRSRALRPYRRSLLFIVMGVLHLVAFGAAGILASHIITAGDEVTVARSSRCGPWVSVTESGSDPISDAHILQASYIATLARAGQQYVQDCPGDSQSLPECNMFKRSQLPWVSRANTSCPFDDLCLGPLNSGLSLDTGLVDSRDDLGINGREGDRIQWRKNITCVPITTDGHSKNGTSFVNYRYPYYRGRNAFNYTAIFTDLVIPSITPCWDFLTLVSPMQLICIQTTQISGCPNTQSLMTFNPIPALSILDTDLSLYFTTVQTWYTAPSDDLWLPAHLALFENFQASSGPIVRKEIYFPDNQVTVLACLEQQQICNPTPLVNNTKHCTRFQPIFTNFEELQDVLSTSRQMRLAYSLLNSSMQSSLAYTIDAIPLLAESLGDGALSLPISPIQWILETENWFKVGLYIMQRLTVDFATSPPSQFSQFIPLNQWNNDTDLRWMCDNQILKRRDYTNFHSLSIGFIFGFGVLVYAINQSLETTVGWVRLKWRSGRWRQRAWWADGTLQLQRRAFEGMGIKDWELDEWDRV